jgi:hypothetical protein
MLKAADGNLIPCSVFRLPLQLVDVKIRGLVAFSTELNVGFNLLGRQSIFNSVDEVAFNDRKKTVIFRLRD